jgi:hypothetical protein
MSTANVTATLRQTPQQDGHEDHQQHRVPDRRRLGMAAGKAQPRLMGNRVGQDRALSMDRHLDNAVQQR